MFTVTSEAYARGFEVGLHLANVPWQSFPYAAGTREFAEFARGYADGRERAALNDAR